MQVKIFTSKGDVGELEREINAWLSENRVTVARAEQSYACDASVCYALVSVWFEQQATEFDPMGKGGQ